MRLHVPGLLASVLVTATILLLPPPLAADEISRATITVDATGPEPVVTSRLTWTADLEGEPRASVTLWLAPGVAVTAANADGRALTVAEAGERAGRRGWSVTLPSPLPPGESRALDITARVVVRGLPGIGTHEEGGRLLPGTGWFPSTAPEVDERLVHSIEFTLPEGWSGVGTGDPTGAGGWIATLAGRPYAVWGNLRAEDASLGEQAVVAWRPAGAEGPLPRAERLGALLGAVTSGVGDLPGAGPIKLVHIGGGAAAGGMRTLFWNEAEAAAEGDDRDALLVDRDLAGGWGTAAWTEAFRFEGDQAAFLSRAVPIYLGDVAVIALDRSDEATGTERVIIGSRRSEFLAGRESGDRALQGLPPTGAESDWVLSTRGALVAHLVGEACPTRAMYIKFLRWFRETYGGGDVDAVVFAADLGKQFPNQHTVLDPFFRTTDLPAFRIVEHGPDDRDGPAGGERYRIKVENTGPVAGFVDVSTFTQEDYRLRTFRTYVEPGQTRGVIFRGVSRVARVELDPRGVVPQSALVDQSVELQRAVGVELAPFVPSFSFSIGSRDFVEIQDLELELASVTIRNFNGYIQWWETHHGPSGAVLLGKGTIEVRPGGEHAESFRKQMRREALTFEGSELFIRFPVEAWARIEPQLGIREEPGHGDHLVARRRQVYEFSFPKYFYEDSRAQVPPPGSALVIFTLGEDERRGWVRRPLPTGTVHMELWDHLRGQTIWEETR